MAADKQHLRRLDPDSIKHLRRLSCGRDSPNIEGECRTTRQCQDELYPGLHAVDCKRNGFGDSDVGECYCRERGRDEVLCGCIDTGTEPNQYPNPGDVCKKCCFA